MVGPGVITIFGVSMFRRDAGYRLSKSFARNEIDAILTDESEDLLADDDGLPNERTVNWMVGVFQV